MQADGKGWLYVPTGLQDGPLPTHYEPQESVFRNPLYEQQSNPTRKVYGREDNPYNPSPGERGDPEVYPYVLTTSRLTEHHTAGGMSRHLPYLSELQPEMFVEVSPELAGERGLRHLGWATVVTSRSAIEARVLVTDRLTPLRVAGRITHQIWLPYHWGSVGVVTGDSANDLFGVALDPNVLIQESKVTTCDIRPGRRPHGPELVTLVDEYRQRAGVTVETGTHLRRSGTCSNRSTSSRTRTGPGRATARAAAPTAATPTERRSDPDGSGHDGRGIQREHRIGGQAIVGPVKDVAHESGYEEHPPRVGFFTDTSVCIGCKACEVACKEWNLVPDDGFDLLGMSYDNTGMLGANSWRHVAFIEQPVRPGRQRPAFEGVPTGPSGSEATASTVAEGLESLPSRGSELGQRSVDLGMPSFELPGARTGAESRQEFRWLMASDVCKHCTHAGCLDVCPTGALFRTEFGTVVVQQDICNGCGYCVSGCPYGVIERREGDGRAWKCTLCYDRLHGGLEPACAKACPTESIQFGELDELRERAQQRVRAAARARRPGGPALRREPATTGSAGRARSSCSSTSPRSTACRPTRWSRRGTCPGCGSSPPSRARPCWVRSSRSSRKDGAGERGGRHGWRRRSRPAGPAVGPGPRPPLVGDGARRSGRRGRADLVVGVRAAGRRPGRGRRGGRAGDDGSREQPMVPRASFSSYYGRPVLKPPAWEDDIAVLLLPRRPRRLQQRAGRRRGPDGPAGPAPRRPAWGRWPRSPPASYFLVRDLGRPERFLHMLRVAKPTSPMSMGTWILAGVRTADGDRRRGRAPARPAPAHPAGSAHRRPGPTRRPRRRRDLPGGRDATRRCCARRPPSRPGTRRTRSCRSSSPRARRPARAGSE